MLKYLPVYIICFLLLNHLSLPGYAAGQGENSFLSDWQEGFLDIHQISTGRGNAAFIIMPDGTTMLVDAGDLGNVERFQQEIMPALPDDKKKAGEWIAFYIKKYSEPLPAPVLDYAFMTHHHGDHNGALPEILSNLKIRKFVDRGWPGYDYPSAGLAERLPDNYLTMLNILKVNGCAELESFVPGSNTQFSLNNHPGKYPGFSIRNISGSGKIWTGHGQDTRSLFPEINTLQQNEYPNENMISNTILINYGKFKYFSGADIIGVIPEGAPSWMDVETPVGNVVGPVDVILMNHHGFSDSFNENYIKSLRPKIFINAVWDYYHPQPQVLERIFDKRIYEAERKYFATGLVPGNARRLGDLAKHIQPTGHVVVRVYPGGDKFQVFVLDSTSTDHQVIYESRIYESNGDRQRQESDF
jgi:hypothetical protein